MLSDQNIEEHCINTIRLLAADAVQKANSGHPGMPMGAAPMAHVLWTRYMNYNPENPDWPNRDRFVLSAGHGCMLQYSLLHLTGYDLSLDDIKNFRQLHSKTPGHPEYGLTPGVEVTTGPLGQGFANAIGMAIAQKYLKAHYNRPEFPIIDYHIYAICSDGDMMEGITSEAASIAGHLELGNLIYLYDDNHISIEGSTDLAFNEDVGKRFEAYNWHVQIVENGNDLEAISNAIRNAKVEIQRPSLIKVRTQIGYGSPNKIDKADAHGSPLGEDEVKKTKTNLGFDPDKYFQIPKSVKDFYEKVKEEGIRKEKEWNVLYKNYQKAFPELSKELEQLRDGKPKPDWHKALPDFKDIEKIATRKASGKVLNAIASYFPGLIGGSADLAPSTDTQLKAFNDFSPEDRSGRNFHFGVREHSMGAILNGMALTNGIIPYGATFLIFSEYMRPPIRLAAIMKIKPIFIFTHDSIGLGEDGTTHQPVEQLLSLRSIPNLTLIRPADANETVAAWQAALEHTGGPVAMVLTRQDLPVISQSKYAKASGLLKGAYTLSEAAQKPQLILIGTGSEVHLLLEAQTVLSKDGIDANVVSMPSWELFDKQPETYKEKILPKTIRKRLVVEAGTSLGWQKYATDDGIIIGIDTFGSSAPADALFKEYGFTVENIVNKAKELLSRK
ncbi:transketolase [Taibaiella lutea]|uniref:Transketolase n=1 Tax=Taibaiella lutea TaxID=2608001 RepID=A0A5M6CCD3_9BACT|nr:transketolase [Taibaiella lutea]KAA5532721.1 transketolase [Taibaiella lutea]